MSIDPHLLNKIQAIKILRDRGGTEGEKDAAQHKLTLLMAKHKLTEQDIPDPDFSTRGRYTYKASDFKNFNDAFRKAYRPPPREQQRSTFSDGVFTFPTSKKVQWKGKLLYNMAKARGYTTFSRYITPEPTNKVKIKWVVEFPFGDPSQQDFRDLFHRLIPQLKRACVNARKVRHPKNPNAWDRAFYHAATHVIRERIALHAIPDHKGAKLKDRVAYDSGRIAGEQVSLAPIA